MKVIENDKFKEEYPCVLYFTASWCGPCKRISPEFEKLSETNKDVHFYKIDVDLNTKLATIYNISSMPTFIIFSSESSFTRFTGADSKKLKEGIENIKNIKNNKV